MLADFHLMMAIRRGWKMLAVSREQWLAQFSGLSVPQILKASYQGDTADATEDDYESLAGLWYDQLCAGNTDAERIRKVFFDEAYVHGNSALPNVIFEIRAAPISARDMPMDANTVDSEDGRQSLASTVTITVHAPTKGQVQALTVAIVAILTHSGSYLTRASGGPRYRNLSLERIIDLQPLPALTNEKVGCFRRQIIWTMIKDYIFPPLFGSAGDPAYLSIHDADAVDQWGNHGRVIAGS